MVWTGEALTRQRSAQRGSAPDAVAAPATAPPRSLAKAPLIRLVAASVGCATLAAAMATAWRDGLIPGQAPNLSGHSLASGLEIDLAAGAAALAAGLWLAMRLARRSDAAIAAFAEALTQLAASPDLDQVKPREVKGDLANLAQAYNDVLIALGRRERQLTLHAMAQAEKARLAELAMLRQDISAPLEAAKALARGAAQGEDAPEAARRDRRAIEALGRIAESVLATLDDLTAGAGASATRFSLRSGPVDLAELTEDVCCVLWTQAAAKGLDLAVYIDPQTPLEIQGDPARLRQIISGLASSALAATQDGGVLIEVEPDSPASIRISIHDTGPALARPLEGDPGHPADSRPGDPEGTMPSRMATYRGMVKAMGGAFAAPARRDRGATFAFRLPAQIDDTATPWAGAPSGASTSGGRVLIAVRGPSTRRALSRYIARAGLVAGVHEGDVPVADARLLIGDAAGLETVGQLDIPVIHVADPPDAGGPTTLVSPVASSAILNQPLCRAELETLLHRFHGGQLPQAKKQTTAHATIGAARWATSSVSASAEPALTDAERMLIADLDRAAERDEFSLAYQPQVERDGEQILGVEALLRWTHPTRGMVDPSVFIPLAEKTGRISEVTGWVVDRVLAETHYLTGLQVSFNASALEFADRGFVDRLLATVAETGYDARRLEVEITETAILQHGAPVREGMDRLHAAGIGVALDDFGAGYSSLSHLRRYPFDKLKIDREFITDCSRDMESATVIHAVVSIGRALGMKVIAEGVETQTQRNFLRIAGVYAMQGFLFGRPMPIDSLTPLLGASRAKARG